MRLLPSSQRYVFGLTMVSLTTLFVLHPISGVTAESPTDNQTQNLITISKETTRLTEPLDEAGYVDYVQAINDLYAQGVTKDNNYEVVVRRVMPLDEIDESIREEYFARLNMPIPETDARFYQDFVSYTVDALTDKVRADWAYDEFDRIVSQPWKADEHPEAARWVKEYGPELDQLAEGSQRSRNYTPYVTGELSDEEPYPRMIAILLPSVQQQREIARGLSIRSMGRIATGDLDGAWSDLQAMRRIAQHVGEGFTLIENLVGMAIESMAFQAEVHLLNAPELTTQQTEIFLKDLQALKPLASVADTIDFGERYMGLDTVTTLARHSAKQGLFRVLKIIESLSDTTGRSPFMFPVALQQEDSKPKRVRLNPIDWDATLLLLNQWYDRLAAAGREPDFESRKAEFAEIYRDLQELKEEVTDLQTIFGAIAQGGPRKAMGESVGKILVSLLLPAIDAARSAEDQAEARRVLLQLAFALELQRRESGSLPKSLVDLKPEFKKISLIDPLSGKSLIYQPQETGFLLYSVGRNGIDDKGRSREDADRATGRRPAWDDIVVRVGQ